MPGRKAQPRETLKPAEAAVDHSLETEQAIRAAERTVRRRTYSVDEAAVILGLSRGAAFNFVRDGTIPSFQLGRRRLIPASVLERLVGTL